MAKKTITIANPAELFMDIPKENAQTETATTAGAEDHRQGKSFVATKTEKETKNKRVQLLLYPSLYEKIASRAAASGLSFNEYVNQVFDYITKEE